MNIHTKVLGYYHLRDLTFSLGFNKNLQNLDCPHSFAQVKGHICSEFSSDCEPQSYTIQSLPFQSCVVDINHNILCMTPSQNHD